MTKKVRLTKEILDNAAKMALANLKLDADDMPWVDTDTVNVEEQYRFVQQCFPDSKDEIAMMDIAIRSLMLWCTPKDGFWQPILRKTLARVSKNPNMDLTLSHFLLLLASDEMFCITVYTTFRFLKVVPKDEMVDEILDRVQGIPFSRSAYEISEYLTLLEDLDLLTHNGEYYRSCCFDTDDEVLIDQYIALNEMLMKRYDSIDEDITYYILKPFVFEAI